MHHRQVLFLEFKKWQPNLATIFNKLCAFILLTDIVQGRLDFAKKLGADECLLFDTKDVDVMSKRVVDALGGPPDITLECSGAEASTQLGLVVNGYFS